MVDSRKESPRAPNLLFALVPALAMAGKGITSVAHVLCQPAF